MLWPKTTRCERWVNQNSEIMGHKSKTMSLKTLKHIEELRGAAELLIILGLSLQETPSTNKNVVYSCFKLNYNRDWSQEGEGFLIAQSKHPPSIQRHSQYSSWQDLHPLRSDFLPLLFPTSLSFSLFSPSLSVSQGYCHGGLWIDLAPPGLWSQKIQSRT